MKKDRMVFIMELATQILSAEIHRSGYNNKTIKEAVDAVFSIEDLVGTRIAKEAMRKRR